MFENPLVTVAFFFVVVLMFTNVFTFVRIRTFKSKAKENSSPRFAFESHTNSSTRGFFERHGKCFDQFVGRMFK